MKLKYAELLSGVPVDIDNVGHLRRIKVSEVQENLSLYQAYINICTSSVAEYFEQRERGDVYEKLPLETKANMHVFDLLVSDEESTMILTDALDFFFEETVAWNEQIRMFVLSDADKNDVGIIYKHIWNELRELIAETNYIRLNESEADLSSIANNRARKIAEKLQKGRRKLASEKAKANSSITDFGNIVSIIASYMPGYTYFNIGDLTVYQLYDLYHRFQINEIYQITSTSVAVWGDEKKQFNLSERQQNLTAPNNKDSAI